MTTWGRAGGGGPGVSGLEGSGRVLVVVAHPDDETFGTGSLLLHLAALGVTTAVCCASRGEGGEVRAGVDVPTGGIGELREAELRSAADLMGVSLVRVLGLGDLGMSGDPTSGTICGVPADELVYSIAKVVHECAPDALVTLDAADGHRDHSAIRGAVERLGREQGIPVWLSCLPRDAMRSWAERLAGRDPDSPYLAQGELGTPSDQFTTLIDTSALYERRWEAIRCHASQTSPFDDLPEDLARAFLATEHLIGPLGQVVH